MATSKQAQRRQAAKAKAPPTPARQPASPPRKPIAYDLDMGTLTPFLALERPLPALPGLSPLRPIPVSHSDPTLRKRLVKDVLRVGKWKVKEDSSGQPIFWDVTPATLVDLANNFNRMTRAGYAVNLCWGHGAPGRVGVDAQAIIAPVDQAFVSGDRLWVASYVSPQQAIDLSSKPHQVSIRAIQDYSDGAGNLYSIAMIHAAIVDHAIVGGQHPFMDLSNFIVELTSPSNSGATDMATDTAVATEETATSSSTIDLLRELFALLDPPMALPDDVDDTTLGIALETLIANSQANAEDPADEATEETSGGSGDLTQGLDPYSGGTANMSAKLKKGAQTFDMATVGGMISAAVEKAVAPLQQKFLDLSNTVLSDKSKAAKAAYEKRLGELLATGHVEPTEKTRLEAAGAKYGFDLSILPSGTGKPVIDMGSSARRNASPAPAPLGGSSRGSDDETDEDVAEGMAAFGRAPAKK